MRYTKESFKNKLMEKLPKSNFELLDFTGIKNKCSFKCLNCGNILEYKEADKLLDRARRGLENICKICENTSQKEPRDNFFKQLDSLLPLLTIQPIEEMKWVREKVSWKCNKCNKIFKRAPVNVLRKNQTKCPWCESHFSKYNINILEEKIKDLKGNNFTLISDNYNGKERKILIKCNNCNLIFETSINSFIINDTGCPKCKSSHGEKKIRDYLNLRDFSFEEQKTFQGLNNKKFDFYLELNNKKFAIEYNGKQHYEAIEYFGGEEAFKKQKERDSDKKQFCQKNNIELIIIPYNDESMIETELLAQRLRGIKLTED